ncbi:IclR family transcriptional regulator [Paraburkholderia acidisoli]|uniref:Helix-turn-helix domain-containing protein n=1 Tax=Paraburkholderia acidisoli TaxID=2571748 RepID=A0A7Z2GLN6_9BURK|nr:IclR family transcriptional regulator [Paraburkholderia acidisoli]QGZ64096.1 helix-turn-helix domain-containing protein [Paraburkholderia acidisoli]
MSSPYEVPALRRIHDILDVLAHAQAPVRATAIGEITGLSRSTLYLMLDSLERRGWIEKRADGYIVGVTLFELGSAYVRHDRLQDVFRQEAAAFVAKHNEVVQLAVLDGAEVVYIAREDASRPVRLVSDLGSRLPAHCCALGKALLASLPDDEVNAVLPRQLTAVTARTLTRKTDLLAALVSIRRTGLAQEREEVTAGLACFAAFVGVTALGKRVAVSTSLPLERLDARREKRLAIAVVEMAHRIGKTL